MTGQDSIPFAMPTFMHNQSLVDLEYQNSQQPAPVLDIFNMVNETTEETDRNNNFFDAHQ